MTVEEAKFVKARLKGKNKSLAALEAKPHISPSSAGKIGNRLSNSVNVQEALQNALAKHDITIDRVAQTISEGMSATKTVIIGKAEDAFADEVPDISNRLKAADMASGLLGLKTTKPQSQDPRPIDRGTVKELAAAIRDGDEVQMTHAVFNKKDGS